MNLEDLYKDRIKALESQLRAADKLAKAAKILEENAIAESSTQTAPRIDYVSMASDMEKLRMTLSAYETARENK